MTQSRNVKVVCFSLVSSWEGFGIWTSVFCTAVEKTSFLGHTYVALLG